MSIDKSARTGFFDARNQATRIDVFDEVDDIASADLRGFFRRMGAVHVYEEVVLPLLREGDSQVFAAVRDRPWPPWGLKARQVSAVCQLHLIGDQSFGLSEVHVSDEDLNNVGLIASVYKEALEYLLAGSGRAEVNYLVVDGSRLADKVLVKTGFTRTEDIFITEGARYFTYTIPAEKLLAALGLDRVETPDLLLHDVDDEVLTRNALFHSTIHNGSRAEWSIDLLPLPSEIIRLVRGGHYSKPGGVPTGTGRFGRPEEETEWQGPFERLGPEILVSIAGFLEDAQRQELVDFLLGQEAEFEAATVMVGGEAPKVDGNVRKARTLDKLDRFEPLFAEQIKAALPDVLERLGHTAFPVGEIEIQATASNDRDFFRLHRDADPGDTREISFVYFAHREPKRFSGGELRVFETRVEDGKPVPTEGVETVSPRHNEIVFFPSVHEHEVLPVRVPNQDFADSRFTVNGWIHRAD